MHKTKNNFFFVLLFKTQKDLHRKRFFVGNKIIPNRLFTRTVGEYVKSKAVFEKAIAAFPDYRPFRVFLGLTLYNLADHSKAMELLIKELVATTSDASIKSYERALLFYSDKLDEKFA